MSSDHGVLGVAGVREAAERHPIGGAIPLRGDTAESASLSLKRHGIRLSGSLCLQRDAFRQLDEGKAMHAEVASKRNEIAELCRSYGVARLEIFGSAARAIDFDPIRSDVDFLVEYEPSDDRLFLERHFGLQDDLAATLGNDVDLISALPDNKYLLASINECRELVHEA